LIQKIGKPSWDLTHYQNLKYLNCSILELLDSDPLSEFEILELLDSSVELELLDSEPLSRACNVKNISILPEVFVDRDCLYIDKVPRGV